jgi:hypothetical protein
VLPFLPFLLIGIFLAIAGWGGLVVLILMTVPTLAPRWLFFFLLTLGVTGIALPVIYFLHRRFPSEPPAEQGVIVREALMVGLYADLLAWLLPGGVLNIPLALFLMGGLILIEILLRMRERTRFKPKEINNE